MSADALLVGLVLIVAHRALPAILVLDAKKNVSARMAVCAILFLACAVVQWVGWASIATKPARLAFTVLIAPRIVSASTMEAAIQRMASVCAHPDIVEIHANLSAHLDISANNARKNVTALMEQLATTLKACVSACLDGLGPDATLVSGL